MLSQKVRRTLMRITAFLLTLFIVMFMITCNGQSKSSYRISWSADATGVTASWNVYIETQNSNDNWILQPGVNRGNTDLTQFTTIANIPAGTTDTVIELNNDGKWLKAGVEAMSSSGVYTDLGLSAPYQKGTAPPVPSGVMIERLP